VRFTARNRGEDKTQNRHRGEGTLNRAITIPSPGGGESIPSFKGEGNELESRVKKEDWKLGCEKTQGSCSHGEKERREGVSHSRSKK